MKQYNVSGVGYGWAETARIPSSNANLKALDQFMGAKRELSELSRYAK